MEILKRIKTSVLIIVLLIISMQLKAQETNTIRDAFEKSYTLETKGEYAKAIEALKTVYVEDSYEMNIRLGWLNYLSGSFNESIAFYQKAMKIMPYSIEPRFGIVYPAAALGKWDEVITHYKAILTTDTKNTVANYRLGLIYYGKEEYETAYKCFESIVNLYPFDYDGLLMLGWCNFKMGKYREAKILFNKVLLNKPDDESALEGLKYME